MKKLLLSLAAILSIAAVGSTTACERTITQVVHDTTFDTTVVNQVVTKVDTVIATRVDTLVKDHYDTTFVPKVDTVVRTRVDTTFLTKYDTTTITKIDTVVRTKVDTVVVPVHDTTFVPVHDTTFVPVHDTTIVTKIDTVLKTIFDTTVVTKTDTVTKLVHDTTFVPKTDTLYLPSQVVHDTTWVYTKTDPTNPLAGGDPNSGLMVLQVYETYYVVFWHGHFVGIIWQGGGWYDYTTTPYTYHDNWRAYIAALDGSMVMSRACDKPTWQEAAGCLEPLVLVIQLNQIPLREVRPEFRREFPKPAALFRGIH